MILFTAKYSHELFTARKNCDILHSRGDIMSNIKKCSTNLKKNMKIIILCIVFIIIILLILFVWLNFSTKSGDKISETLNYHGYKTYFNYGDNYYDKKGNCYNYDYSEKKECRRELNIRDFATITLKPNNSSIYEINAYINYDKKYEVTDITISFEYNDNIDSFTPKYTLVHNIKDTEDYLRYAAGNDYCFNMNKSQELNLNNIDKCDKTKLNELDDFKDQYKFKLKELKIKEKDLFSYFEWYFNENIKDKIIIDNGSKEKLSYNEIENMIKEHNLNILAYSDENPSVIIGEKNLYYYTFFIEENKVKNIVFLDDFNDNSIVHLIDNKVYIGSDKDDICSYIVDSQNKEQIGKVMNDSYCNNDLKSSIDTSYFKYKNYINFIELTEDELISFVEEYYENNK